MMVILKRPFYAGRGFGRYRVRPNANDPVHMPDSLRHKLPSDAVIVEDYDGPREAPKPGPIFSTDKPLPMDGVNSVGDAGKGDLHERDLGRAAGDEADKAKKKGREK